MKDATKKSVIVAVFVLAIAGCASVRSSLDRKASQTKVNEGGPREPLFLHVLGAGSTNSPIRYQRIVTARVHLDQEFSVSAGDPDDPFAIRYDGAWTTPRFGTKGTSEARPLEALWNSGDAILAGRIDWVDGKLVANLQARNHTTLCYFHGDIALEQAFFAFGGYYRGGGIWATTFVLSTNQNCGPFLKALEDGKIHNPATVGRDGPGAKEWVKGQKINAPVSPRAETPPHR